MNGKKSVVPTMVAIDQVFFGGNKCVDVVPKSCCVLYDFNMCNMRAVLQNTSTTARTYTVHFRTEGVTVEFLSSTLSTASGVTAPMTFKITEVAT